MVVVVFEGLVMSSEPTPAWSQDTVIALEGRTMKIKVSTSRLFRWNTDGWGVENEPFDHSSSNYFETHKY